MRNSKLGSNSTPAHKSKISLSKAESLKRLQRVSKADGEGRFSAAAARADSISDEVGMGLFVFWAIYSSIVRPIRSMDAIKY